MESTIEGEESTAENLKEAEQLWLKSIDQLSSFPEDFRFKSQESKPTNQPIESFPRCGQDHSMQGTT
jgi:hypothetical protein